VGTIAKYILISILIHFNGIIKYRPVIICLLEGKMGKFNVIREIREVKSHLSYSKNIGVFFGAGTSCALGIPNIVQLTSEVENSLSDPFKTYYQVIKNDIIKEPAVPVNIEDILNQIRRIREITGELADKKYLNINGVSAKQLDFEICKKIYEFISAKESTATLEITKQFFAWLSMQNRDYSKEVFTTNYDLIIEKSLEEARIPYFDGFVGSYEPFFWQESIDTFVEKSDITQTWIRLWKLHGSLNWFWKTDDNSKSHSIVRTGKLNDVTQESKELVIYPSKEKYALSRKQPFIAYFDRLRNYLSSGELLFIFSGYSFSDQHINEIVFNSLRQNNRLSIIALFFQDQEVENLFVQASSYLNFIALGPKKAFISGKLGEWEYDKNDLKPSENSISYWDETKNVFKLGDFRNLVNFLITNSGNKDTIEGKANGK